MEIFFGTPCKYVILKHNVKSSDGVVVIGWMGWNTLWHKHMCEKWVGGEWFTFSGQRSSTFSRSGLSMPLLLSFTWWWQSADVIEYCLVLIPREKWTSSSQAPFPNRRGKESPQLWCFCKPGTCQNSQVIFHKINWREIVFQSPNIFSWLFDNLINQTYSLDFLIII